MTVICFRLLAFREFLHTALLFLSEYLSSEIHGSPPRVLLDPMVQIHFALHDFAKISLCSMQILLKFFLL
jgi:hypothetical protein